MRLCCCVCQEWNDLISASVQLNQKRKSLDPYDEIKKEYFFNCFDTEEFCYPGKICVIPEKEEILVCNCYGREIKVFSIEGGFLFTFVQYDKREIGRIIGICVSNGKIFMADRDNHKVQIFDINYNYISSISTGIYKPEWICCQKNGNIIVSTTKSILMIDSNGKLENIVTDNSLVNFSGIQAICCNDRDEIIVADSLNDRMQVFDKRGQFISTFQTDHYIDPYDICVDQNNNILATSNYEDKILLFSPTGRSIQKLSIQKPTALCIFNQKIIVGDEKGFVNIYSN